MQFIHFISLLVRPLSNIFPSPLMNIRSEQSLFQSISLQVEINQDFLPQNANFDAYAHSVDGTELLAVVPQAKDAEDFVDTLASRFKSVCIMGRYCISITSIAKDLFSLNILGFSFKKVTCHTAASSS